MAKAKQQQSKNATTVTTTTITGGGNRRSRRRSVRRANNGSTNPSTKRTSVRTVVRRTTRTRRNRRRDGPNNRRPGGEITQTVTATLGTVGSNQGDTVELEMAALLNPALIKETTGSNVFGPLQMYASTHALWKMERLTLRLTPLVGSSAVSGTAVRASLNMTSGPAAPSWSALGARKHVDTNPGRLATLTLTAADVPGPKNGWFYTNTKNDAGFSVGGALEIHTLGKTMSTYQNAAYTGPLFLAEVTGTWKFKNYEPQPGLLNLVKTEVKEPAGTVKIHAKPGEPVTLSIPEAGTFAGLERLNPTASATPGEIIWEVADSAAKAVTSALPQPWQWLFKGGWWFLKRIANKKPVGSASVAGEPDGGEVAFRVYASIADAQNDVPCIASSAASTQSIETQGLRICQITPGTIGMPETGIATHNMLPPAVMGPYVYRGPCLMAGDPINTPKYTAWTVVDNTHHSTEGPALQSGVVPANQTSAWSMCTLQLPGSFFQDQRELDPLEVVAGTFDINYWNVATSTATRLGTAYGCNQYRARTTGLNSNRVCSITTVLWLAERTDGWNGGQFQTQLWNGYISADPANSGAESGVPLTRGAIHWQRANVRYPYRTQVTAGKWYVTFWMQYDPDQWVWLDEYNLQFTLQPGNWEAGQDDLRWDIEPESLGTGLWSLQDLTFYPIGQQPRIVVPPSSSRVRFDLPEGEGSDTEDDDTDYLTDTSASEDQQEAPADDDLEHFCKPPPVVMQDLTYAGRNLSNELWSRGVPDAKAWEAGQLADPSPSFRRWQKSFNGALVRGLTPAKAHELATREFKAQRESRGHAE